MKVDKPEVERVINQLKEIDFETNEDGADWPCEIIDNTTDRFLAGLLTAKDHELAETCGDDELLREELIGVCKWYLQD